MPCAASSASRSRSSRSATTSPAPTRASPTPCCGCAPRCVRSGRSRSTPTSRPARSPSPAARPAPTSSPTPRRPAPGPPRAGCASTSSRPARGSPARRGPRHRDPARPVPGHGRRPRQRLQPARRRPRHGSVRVHGRGRLAASPRSTRAAGCASRPSSRGRSGAGRAGAGSSATPSATAPSARRARSPCSSRARSTTRSRSSRTTPPRSARATPSRSRSSTTTRWPTASRSRSTRRASRSSARATPSAPSPRATSSATSPRRAGLRAERFVTIEYAAYADGMKERAQTARVRVAVTPLPDAQRLNQSPVARSFSATVTAGDPITMTVPTFGVDPDGDSVTVTGIVGADGGAVDLTHGRVVAIGPSTIRYESYPLAAGTEVITYEVRDRFGATSRAFVRVGVVQPGDPQPPVAVADEVFAAPGKTVTVKPLQNDLIARGDVVELDDGLPQRRRDEQAVAGRRGQHRDDEGARATPRACTSSSTASATASSTRRGPRSSSVPVKDYVNPPVARDDVAAPKPGETSTLVDVLANDTDIDSDPATLRIVERPQPRRHGRERPGAGHDPRPPVRRALRHRGRGRRPRDGADPRPDRRQRPALRRGGRRSSRWTRTPPHGRAQRPREVAARPGRLGDDGRDGQRLPGAEPRGLGRRQPHADA